MKNKRKFSIYECHGPKLVLLAIAFLFIACKQSHPENLNKGIAKSKVTDSIKKEGKDTAMLPLISEPMKKLDSLFTEAIRESRNPRPNKVIRNLTRIAGNPDLPDTIINNDRYVLMVSWSDDPSVYPEQGIYNTEDNDIWLTAAPQIKDKCRQFFKTEKDPIMRLRQLLGLEPFTIELFFLEIWVKPADLFRPCPDNETDDTFCDTNLPANITEDYREWFNNLRAIQYVDCTDTYFGEKGYPWTQLGYTYDWSPNNPSHVGLSEFVAKRNINVFVKSKTKTNEYCATQ